MNATAKNGTKPTHNEISARAFQLWEKDGRKAGQDLKYWTQAEKELRAASQSTSAPQTPTPPQMPSMEWSKPAAKRARA